jgi:hypothetical protein
MWADQQLKPADSKENEFSTEVTLDKEFDEDDLDTVGGGCGCAGH